MILSGTGCCSIYPLLGCRLRPQWKFLATGEVLIQNCRLLTDYSLEIDENNARTAEQNVKLNELESRIRIVRTDSKDPLFPLDKFGQKR